MLVNRWSRLALVLAVAWIEVSCGETFRLIAIPQNPNPPDPESLHFALVLSQNAPDTPGGSTRIDVSGDTNVGTATVGLGPIHAAMDSNGNQAFVANNLEDTITSYPTSIASIVTTISLPAGSAPVYVYTTQADTVYVANSGNHSVSVISVGRSVVTQTVQVGNNPVSLAETPNGKKLYVVNQADNTVTAINTIDDSISATIPVGANPIWAAARSDNARAYVLNQGSGTISVIDTVTDTVMGAPVAVGAANFAVYDKASNRIYLTVPGTKRLVVLNTAVDPPVVVSSVDLSVDPTGGTNPPCPAACVLDSVAALPDGSRAYVASHEVTATCSHLDGIADDTPPCIVTRVSVIRTPSNTVLRTIDASVRKFVIDTPTGKMTELKNDYSVVPVCNALAIRRYIGAAGDSSRIYVTDCDAGGTDIVRTSDDTFVLTLPAPFSSLPPDPGQSVPPRQRPVFVLSGR